MFGIVKNLLVGGAKYAIKGLKGSAKVAESKASVAVARIDMQREVRTSHIERARILNGPGSMIKETMHFIVIVAAVLLIGDLYIQLRGDMSDDLIKWFLGFASSMLAGYFGLRIADSMKEPDTLRAKGTALKDHTEAVVAEKKAEQGIFDADDADDLSSLAGLEDKRMCEAWLWDDVFRSNKAAELKIENYPQKRHRASVFANLQHLGTDVVDKILLAYREEIDNPNLKFICTSGYRSPAVNKAVGGVGRSQHRFGQAVDFILMDAGNETLYDLWLWLMNNRRRLGLQIDQCIYESRGVGSQKVKWIHLSAKRPGKGINRDSFFELADGKRI